MSPNRHISAWVEAVARLTRPDRVHWCDGSDREAELIVGELRKSGEATTLDRNRYPRCHVLRTQPGDADPRSGASLLCVDGARRSGGVPAREARETVGALFKDSMRGRTLYVLPMILGAQTSTLSHVFVQLTDSPSVVMLTRLFAQLGAVALEALGERHDYGRGLHSLGDRDPTRRYLCVFPNERLVWSINSGLPERSVFARECFGIRLASTIARDEGWLAEHMSIFGVEDPAGNTTYMCAALPSGCGKTALANLDVPRSQEGWRVWPVGDDVAWLRIGHDGRLWATSPELGVYASASTVSRPSASRLARAALRDALYVNVGVTADGYPFWEDGADIYPTSATTWDGRRWTPGSSDRVAHPEARIALRPSEAALNAHHEDGVPISAILFGSRRSSMFPLVYEAYDWEHGVYAGTLMSVDAATPAGATTPDYDPMAMASLCGYELGAYLDRWATIGARRDRFPRVFHLNCYRRSRDGKLYWPGGGDNVRILEWIHDRVHGNGRAEETPIGFLPADGALNSRGLDVTREVLRELASVDLNAWRAELAAHEVALRALGEPVPDSLWRVHAGLLRGIQERRPCVASS